MCKEAKAYEADQKALQKAREASERKDVHIAIHQRLVDATR